MTQQLYDLFKRNFPYLNVDEGTAKSLLGNPENRIFARYDRNSRLIAASVIYKNIIIMLAVDANYRRHGIGSALLDLSEDYIKANGGEKVVFGVGASDYLAPGVPTPIKPIEQELTAECLWQGLDRYGCEFLRHRGYVHENSGNIFDMDMEIDENICFDIHVGYTIDGVNYRLAELSDKAGVIECCNKGADYFAAFYKNDELYRDGDERVLIADIGGEIVGNLLVSTYGEPGTIGCITVSPVERGKKIGSRMSIAATSYIKEKGLKRASLSYTYSGLDKMYGSAGYKICVYYFMAQKKFD